MSNDFSCVVVPSEGGSGAYEFSTYTAYPMIIGPRPDDKGPEPRTRYCFSAADMILVPELRGYQWPHEELAMEFVESLQRDGDDVAMVQEHGYGREHIKWLISENRNLVVFGGVRSSQIVSESKVQMVQVHLDVSIGVLGINVKMVKEQSGLGDRKCQSFGIQFRMADPALDPDQEFDIDRFFTNDVEDHQKRGRSLLPYWAKEAVHDGLHLEQQRIWSDSYFLRLLEAN